jgi:hypothetical protein
MQNKNNSLIILFCCIAALCITSCKKNDDSNDAPFDYTYFPMQVGDSLIYNVHLYDKDLNEIDSSYQLLERVESIFDDNEGRPTFRLERYVRADDSSPWAIYKVWTANLTPTLAEKEEDNITYIKLAFPVEQNLSWNGNAKNIYENDDLDDYRITSLDEPLSLGALNFDSSLTVTQLNADNLIESRYYIEQYVKGTGMVYKEQTDSLQNNSGYKKKIHTYSETLIFSNK